MLVGATTATRAFTSFIATRASNAMRAFIATTTRAIIATKRVVDHGHDHMACHDEKLTFPLKETRE